MYLKCFCQISTGLNERCISVQNLSSLTLKTKELWKGGGKHPPPPPSATTRQKSPVLIGLSPMTNDVPVDDTIKIVST